MLLLYHFLVHKLNTSDAENLYASVNGSSTFGELGTVTAGSLASGFGTINIESDITTSTKLTGGSLKVGKVTASGSTIGFEHGEVTKSEFSYFIWNWYYS